MAELIFKLRNRIRKAWTRMALLMTGNSPFENPSEAAQRQLEISNNFPSRTEVLASPDSDAIPSTAEPSHNPLTSCSSVDSIPEYSSNPSIQNGEGEPAEPPVPVLNPDLDIDDGYATDSEGSDTTSLESGATRMVIENGRTYHSDCKSALLGSVK